MLTHKDILQAEQIRNSQVKRIYESSELWYSNKQNQEALDEWRKACNDYHNTTLAIDYLWSDETRMKIKSGDRETIDDVLLFLEVDPWFFRSGYLKEWLIDNLMHAPLTEEDKVRIRQIIIAVAGGRNRREFRRFCKLATRVTSSEFEATIA